MQPAPRATDDRHARALALAALGIVFGDIGTSPLYALRVCFEAPHGIALTPDHLFGVLSLVFWSLVVVIAIKYVLVVMRADNEGQGGILALMALVAQPNSQSPLRGRRRLLTVLGLFGASLLYSDGMITPAISVLSAVEGLGVVTPVFAHYVVPITVAILFGLFLVQKRGTAVVGALFGPITLVWFLTLGALGVSWIVRAPEVLAALSPTYAIGFLREGGLSALAVMGAVFLAVTGGEALYADIGHFGARPIRLAWFSVVLPALVLNYFGQGALLLTEPAAVVNPFFRMAPAWALIPLVVLATMATCIASQAVITGSFSLTWQAARLGYLPRVQVRHTSAEERGQIYIPFVNWALLVASVGLVLGFGTSSKLAAAYGVAVASDMLITTVLLALAMRQVFHWPLARVVGLTALFLVVDLVFFGANIIKVPDGGWFPLLLAAGTFTLMTTWRSGRALLRDRMAEHAVGLDVLLKRLADSPPARVPGTAVFLTGAAGWVPPPLLHLLRHVGTLHERVIFLTVETTNQAFVSKRSRLEVEGLAPTFGIHRVIGRYGFMERPDVPTLLLELRKHGLDVDPDKTTYVLGRETLLATGKPGMALWRERLFALMSTNAGRANELFGLPSDHVLEIGAQIEL